MRVLEDQRELVVFGDFGEIQGRVFIDSVEMSVIFWSKDTCRASIPDTGKGSAGPVEVAARGYRSNAIMLSEWRMTVWDGGYTWLSRNRQTFDLKKFDIHVRLDLHSRLAFNKLANSTLKLSRDSRETWSYWDTESGVEFENTTFMENSYVKINFLERKITFAFGKNYPGELDSLYTVLSYYHWREPQVTTRWDLTPLRFPPPQLQTADVSGLENTSSIAAAYILKRGDEMPWAKFFTGPIKINVFDITGRLLQGCDSDDDNCNLNLIPGAYLVLIRNQDFVKTLKVIII